MPLSEPTSPPPTSPPLELVGGTAGNDIATHALGFRETLTQHESVDVALVGTEEVLNIAATPSLFGPMGFTFSHFEEFDPKRIKDLDGALKRSGNRALGIYSNFGAKQRKAAAEWLTEYRTPDLRSRKADIRKRAETAGVTLGGDQINMIDAAVGSHTWRIDNLVSSLAILKMFTPTDDQLRTLLGDTAAAALPWTLLDLALAGKFDEAHQLVLSGTVEPFSTVSFLHSQLSSGALSHQDPANTKLSPSAQKALAKLGAVSQHWAKAASDASHALRGSSAGFALGRMLIDMERTHPGRN